MSEDEPQTTATSWLELMRRAEDPSLGQGLERLARLAAAAHRRQAAAQAPAGESVHQAPTQEARS